MSSIHLPFSVHQQDDFPLVHRDALLITSVARCRLLEWSLLPLLHYSWIYSWLTGSPTILNTTWCVTISDRSQVGGISSMRIPWLMSQHLMVFSMPTSRHLTWDLNRDICIRAYPLRSTAVRGGICSCALSSLSPRQLFPSPPPLFHYPPTPVSQTANLWLSSFEGIQGSLGVL